MKINNKLIVVLLRKNIFNCFTQRLQLLMDNDCIEFNKVMNDTIYLCIVGDYEGFYTRLEITKNAIKIFH